MAQSDLEAANGALRKLGANKIASLAGTDDVSVLMNDRIDICKKAVLRMHPWNFAIKRTHLYPFPKFAISNVTLPASEVLEITHAAATGANAFAVDDWVTIEGVAGTTGANGTWKITVVSSTTVIRVSAPNVTTITTYVAGTLDFIRKSPAYGFAYLYSLPTDSLRVLRVQEETVSPRWRIEDRQIASDEDELDLKYVYNVTDYTKMDVLFYEVLQTYLAHDVCYRITQSSTLKSEMEQELRKLMAKARFDDATEDSAEELEANDWLAARGASLSAWFNVGRY